MNAYYETLQALTDNELLEKYAAAKAEQRLAEQKVSYGAGREIFIHQVSPLYREMERRRMIVPKS